MADLSVLCLLLSLSLETAAPAAAILPVRAEQALVDEAPMYERLDAVLRKAGGVSVQDGDVTRANVAAAAAAGIVCGAEARACLGKLAALDEVERVLAPRAARKGKQLDVTILVVDRGTRAAEVTGSIPAELDDAAARQAARSLVERALHAPLEAPAAAAGGPATATAPATSSQAAVTKPLPVVGTALLGAGSALVAGGLTTALVLNGALGKPELYADRSGKIFAGQAGVAVAAAGALVVAGGVWLVVTD